MHVLDRKQWAKVVAKVWANPGFGEELKANPKAALASIGVSLPETVKRVEIVDNLAEVLLLWVPPKPDGLSEQELEAQFEYMHAAPFSATC